MSRTIKTFAETLGLLNRKTFIAKCDEHLSTALHTLESLPQQKGKAVITIQLTIAYNGEHMDITPTIKSKLPEEPPFRGNTFWMNDGELSVSHPNQQEMFAVKEANSSIREAV
jgi:hypothetical protein